MHEIFTRSIPRPVDEVRFALAIHTYSVPPFVVKAKGK